MENTVVLDVLIFVLVSFIHDYQELLVIADNHPVVIQCRLNLAATENGCSEAELVTVLFPLLLQVRRADDDCAKMQVPGHG